MGGATSARPCVKWTVLLLMLIQNAGFVLVSACSSTTSHMHTHRSDLCR